LNCSLFFCNGGAVPAALAGAAFPAPARIPAATATTTATARAAVERVACELVRVMRFFIAFLSEWLTS
jgi:hypothetical protein